ncbi:MAG TPA: hypothetical protein VM012_04555 [Flavitalea sp.]|nr:hypothetical protein [Flavitalea sp.]
MAAKSDKGNSGKPAPKSNGDIPGKTTPKAKKVIEDDEDDIDDENGVDTTGIKKNAKVSDKKGKEDDEDDDDDVEVVDEWEKPEEEETWDPDFEEFDLPKSKTKKATGPVGKKTGKGEEEDDVAFDEEFKDLDLFNDAGVDDEDDDF